MRGVVPQHGRRHSRTGSFSLSPSVAGVPVGRQLPVLSRHRRNTSRVTDAMAAAVRLPHGLPPQSPAAGLSPQVSRGLGQMSPQVSLKLPEQLGSGGADAGSGGGAKQPQRSTSRVAAAAAAPFAALLRWLAGLAAALVGAARAHSGQFAVIAIGCIIIGLQLLLVLEQRQELAQLRALPLQQPSWQAGAGSCADTGSCGDVAQAAGQAAAALGREVASLQQALRQLQAASSSWQGQLEAATATAAKLAKSLQQLGR